MPKGLKIRTKTKTGPSPQIALNSQSSYTGSQGTWLTKEFCFWLIIRYLSRFFSHHCQAEGKGGRPGVAEAGGISIRNT